VQDRACNTRGQRLSSIYLSHRVESKRDKTSCNMPAEELRESSRSVEVESQRMAA
jgi:hypothetical protein